MSIFGFKKEQGQDLESLTLHVRELHKMITDLKQTLHNTIGSLITELKIQGNRSDGLHKRINDLEALKITNNRTPQIELMID